MCAARPAKIHTLLAAHTGACIDPGSWPELMLCNWRMPAATVNARKDDAPAAGQAAISNVDAAMPLSGGWRIDPDRLRLTPATVAAAPSTWMTCTVCPLPIRLKGGVNLVDR